MNIKLSQAIDGFTLAKQVAGCSDYTIRNYRLDLQGFSTFLDHDPPPARYHCHPRPRLPPPTPDHTSHAGRQRPRHRR